MTVNERRYDIDNLRVIAIALLLVYHTAIAFQPWGFMIGFITNDEPLTGLWYPMAMLNIWRIPLLFFISGMGVYFSIANRTWKELFRERTRRILMPFITGVFVVVPLQIVLIQAYYHQRITYVYSSGHLWFLGNIFIYFAVLLPLFFYLKRKEKSKWTGRWKKLSATPLITLIVTAAFLAEAYIVRPVPFELYAMTWHGFFLGLIAFFAGFWFMLSGVDLWDMLQRWRWTFLIIAISLYTHRALQLNMKVTDAFLILESAGWIFSIFAFGYKYLNRPGRRLSYLAEAAYPVYIIHMLFLYAACMLVFPMNIPAKAKFLLVLLLTTAGSLEAYEYGIRKIRLARRLFGLKPFDHKDDHPVKVIKTT